MSATTQRVLSAIASLATGLTATAVPAYAQAPATDFYAGKTITLLIGFGSGGGNDIWARLISRHIGKHLPGRPNVIAQNLPGGGGLLVANQLYNISPKDGTVIALINRGIPMEPLLGGMGTKFDSLKFNYLGSPDRDTPICVSRLDSGVTTMKELFSKELIVGATGSGADSAIYPEFMGQLLGMKCKVVKGYKGSNEVRLAMERGEVQGICGSNDSIMTSDISRSGKIKVLFQAALTPDPRLKDVALGGEGARTAEERRVLELFFMRAALGRPFIAPPGVPEDRVALLRKAFDATVKDPAFNEEAAKQSFTAEPMTGDELAQAVKRAYDMPPAVIKQTAEVLGRIAASEKSKAN